MGARSRLRWSPRTIGSRRGASGTALSRGAAWRPTSPRSTSSGSRTDSSPSTGSRSTGFAPTRRSGCSQSRSTTADRRSRHNDSTITKGDVEMRITVVGRGNVGGGLADMWERAGHYVTRLGRDGGDVSDADVVLVAVPGGAFAEAFDRLRGFEGKTMIDATNLYNVT